MMMLPRRRPLPLPRAVFPVAALASALFAAGCGHHAAETAPSDNRLRDTLYASPQTFDPALCESVPNGQMLQQVFEGLVQYNEENKIVPCLADKWDISPDGLIYTFHLRPGVKFQNGMPMTAGDVAFSLQRALDPALKSQVAPQYLQDIVGAKDVISGKTLTLSGVKVIDPQTVAVTISSPKAYWIDTLTYPTAYIVCKAVVSKIGRRPLLDTDDAQGVGTGPFTLTRYVKDSEADMDANKAYWGGAPALSGVTFKVITDASTRHAEFISGQIDLMRQLEFGNYESDKNNPQLAPALHAFPRAGLYYFGMNQNVYAPFKDARVRQALAYATDKETLSKRATAGVYPPAQDFLPPGIVGSDPNFRGLPFDPLKAKSLLAEAGYPGGKGLPPLDIYVSTNRPFADSSADLLRQMYQNVGIPAQVKQMEFGAMIAAMDSNKQLPCFFFGWYADYLDPQDFYSLFFESASPETIRDTGTPVWMPSALTRMWSRIRRGGRRCTVRPPRSSRNDAAVIPIYDASDPELVKPYVKNLGDCLMGHLPYRHTTLK